MKYAFRTFFSILSHGRIPDDVVAALVSVPEPELKVVRVTPPDPVDRATQMLALLQRDGRLLDFLMEDLAAYPDAQVGAAVRDVHAGSRQALERYVSLAPVMHEEEGQTVTVDRGADAARIKIVGNVAPDDQSPVLANDTATTRNVSGSPGLTLNSSVVICQALGGPPSVARRPFR